MNPRVLPLAALFTLAAFACTPANAPVALAPVPSGQALAAAQPPPSSSAAPPGPPETKRVAVTDVYQGASVVDEYRWLEDPADPAVKTWSSEQNAWARAHLDAIGARPQLRARIRELVEGRSPSWYWLQQRGRQVFGMKSAPPKQQPYLFVTSPSLDPATERVLVDPTVIDPSGGTTIDFYVPSLDGKRVAVSLSKGGSESGTLHIVDVATGKETGDVIPRVNNGTAGGSVAWNADASGFFYTRYPHEGERAAADIDFYQQVYFHKLGAPVEKDSYAIGKDFPRIAEIHLRPSNDGKYVRALVANGDGGEFALYLMGPSRKWTQVTTFADQVIEAAFGPDDALYLLSRKAAPRGCVLRVDPAKPDLARASVVVDAGDPVIDDVLPTATKLYVTDLVGGPSQVRVFALPPAGSKSAAKLLETIPSPPVSSVWGVTRLDKDEVLFASESFVAPPAWTRYAPGKGVTPTPLVETSKANFSDVEVVRESCPSKDGTMVPMSVLHKKGAPLDGSSPALLTGYGGYGISERPYFSQQRRIWLDAGGVFADASVRGGGEYGEEWHRAGNLTHKQNVFDDFYACAQTLTSKGYTRADRLAIEGGSNGGLLMGAELTQHPEAFRAVVSHVGIYDMLRVELAPNGAFNVTEFGSVKDPEQWKALYAYSPYHRVVDGTKYPAVLMLTGANDPRVDPYHSRKFTARLQAATAPGLPVLLRTSDNTGHGMGTPLDETVEQIADVDAFLFEQLGMSLP